MEQAVEGGNGQEVAGGVHKLVGLDNERQDEHGEAF
jgi:hypothetical protein